MRHDNQTRTNSPQNPAHARHPHPDPLPACSSQPHPADVNRTAANPCSLSESAALRPGEGSESSSRSKDVTESGMALSTFFWRSRASCVFGCCKRKGCACARTVSRYDQRDFCCPGLVWPLKCLVVCFASEGHSVAATILHRRRLEAGRGVLGCGARSGPSPVVGKRGTNVLFLGRENVSLRQRAQRFCGNDSSSSTSSSSTSSSSSSSSGGGGGGSSERQCATYVCCSKGRPFSAFSVVGRSFSTHLEDGDELFRSHRQSTVGVGAALGVIHLKQVREQHKFADRHVGSGESVRGFVPHTHRVQ